MGAWVRSDGGVHGLGVMEGAWVRSDGGVHGLGVMDGCIDGGRHIFKHNITNGNKFALIHH